MSRRNDAANGGAGGTGGATLALPATTEASLESGSLFFIGNATVLLRYAGFTLLTDPNFLHRGEVAHLGYGLRTTRLTDPAMRLEDLPPLDLIVLSHMHEDHFDRGVQQQLDRAIPIVTTREATSALTALGFTATHALDTWQTFTAVKGDVTLRITAMPGTHAPGLLSRLLPPVMGSLLEFQRASGEALLRLYITGDTLIHEQLREIPRRYPAIDLALLHLGGTRVVGLLVTMDAGQGVEMLRIVAPRTAIPIHYDDYTVFTSSLDDFKRAVGEAGLPTTVQYLDRGDTYTFAVPAAPAVPAAHRSDTPGSGTTSPGTNPSAQPADGQARPGLLAAALDGMIGGAIGTAAMSLLMLAARRAGLVGELPPERITAAALDALDLKERPRLLQDALAALVHFTFGGVAGAIFAVTTRLPRLPRLPVPPGVLGALYGSLIWVVSYAGWIPALGLLPPPSRDEPGRPPLMVLAHGLYGWTLATYVKRRASRSQE